MINFGKAYGPNPAAELAGAIGTAVAQAPYQEAQLQSIGQQVLAPYMRQAQMDPTNPALIAKIQQIAKMYHIPPPIAGTQGGSWGSSGVSSGAAPAGQPENRGELGGGGAAAPAAQPAAPAGAMAFGKPPAGADVGTAGGPAQSFQYGQLPQPDPKLAVRAQAYTQLLQQAAANPSQLRDPVFHARLVQAAAAVSRGPDEIKADIQGAIAKSKQQGAVTPLGGQPAGTAANPTNINAPGTGAAANPLAVAPPPQGAAPQPQGGTVGSPAPGPGETQSYMRPVHEGPLRVDVNSWLGPLSLEDFKTLSGMTPQERIAALRQQGRDLNGFDQTWLNSQPSLDPAQQITLAHDAATAIGNDIRDGATPDQIKLSVATYRPYLTPAQNAELDSNITDQLNGALQIRRSQVEQTGFLRSQTLALLNKKFDASQQNISWEHNYKYTVLNDKNAQWSQAQSVRAQNAMTQAGRLQEEIARDQANGLVDASGRPIKGGGGGVKSGELINSARGLLTSINSAVNEYNTRLQNALNNPGQGGAVNAPMEADIQNQIDAYNQLVDQMNARGMHYFKHYTGPDQSSIAANTAAATAASAVGSQGQQLQTSTKAAGPPAGSKHGKMHGVSGWLYPDGTFHPDNQ